MSDFTALIELVNEYVAEVESGTSNCDRLAKYDSYIMEAAIEAVHGKDIWDRLNPILNEM
jgi:hypothetical protein